MTGYLPLELTIEILKRLPVKSLLRFRCVCKTWHSLIGSPDFITLHLNQTSSDSNCDRNQTLVRHYSMTHREEMYSLHFDNETFDECPTGIEFPFRKKTMFYFRVVGCCNGLVCLSDDIFGHTSTIILWNPSIRRFLTLPVPRIAFRSDGSNMYGLGFGVDPNTNDHKVVRMNYLKCGDEYIVPPEVEVFSLRSGNWKGIRTSSPYCIPEYVWSQALIKGVVHWVAYHLTRKNGVRTFRSLVMSFDMGSEEFGELNLPKSLANESPLVMSAAIFGGLLTILQYDSLLSTTTCSVWVMKQYGIVESWSKQFTIDLVVGLGSVLGLRRNGEILLATRLGDGSGILSSYHCGNGTSWNIGKCGTRHSFYVDSYRESLILLTKGNKVLEREGSAPSFSEENSGW